MKDQRPTIDHPCGDRKEKKKGVSQEDRGGGREKKCPEDRQKCSGDGQKNAKWVLSCARGGGGKEGLLRGIGSKKKIITDARPWYAVTPGE